MSNKFTIPPVSDAEIKTFEDTLGVKLPSDYKTAMKRGTIPADTPEGDTMYNIKKILSNWGVMKTLLEDGDFHDAKPKAGAGVKNEWYNPKWIPISNDGGGNSHCIDMDPGAGGHTGQIIQWWHDMGDRVVVAKSYADWIKSWDTVSAESLTEHASISNKLMYRLGLEELAEIAPVAEVPSVSEQELELDVDQIGSDILNDVAQVDIAQADTATMEEVKSALESALKHGCDHSSLVFANRTLQMVDKRWGFDYPITSMESSTETLVPSMEDGIGQRLKDMGKALLEMLKKVWAKVKEWVGKFLQLIGLKKKKLEEIKERATLVRDERWEDLDKNKWQHRVYSDGRTHTTIIVNRPESAAPHKEPEPATTAPKKSETVLLRDGLVDKFQEFTPHLSKSFYLLHVDDHAGDFTAQFFIQTIKNLTDGVDVSNAYAHGMTVMADMLRKRVYLQDVSLEPKVVHEKIEEAVMARLTKRHAKLGGMTTEYTLPGGAYFIATKPQGEVLSAPKVDFRPAKEKEGKELSADKVKWLTSDEVIKVQRELSDLMDYLTESAQFDSDFMRSFEEGISSNFKFLANPLVASHFSRLASEFATSNIVISQKYLRYVKAYSDALSQYLNLCLDHEVWVKRKERYEKHA